MSKKRKEYELIHDWYIVVDTIADRDALETENIREMLRVGISDDKTSYTRKNNAWVLDIQPGNITAGNGMDFPTIAGSGSIVLGTPSPLSLSSTNSVTSTSHTHALSIASFAGSSPGLVPVSTGDTSLFLRADGSWKSNIPVEIYDYVFSTDTTDTDPGNGKIKFDNAIYANVTEIYIDDLMHNGIDVSDLLKALKQDDTVYLQSLESVNGAVYFNVTGDSVQRTGYHLIPVSHKDNAGTAVNNNAHCMFTIGTNIPDVNANYYLTAVTVNSINDVDFTMHGTTDITTIDFGHILTAHDNVSLTSLADDDILKYDSASSKWINVPIPVIGAPLSHASTHMSGGADEILLDELGTPTDNTTLNASSLHHGLLPKLSGVATEYLNGIGGWSTMTDNYLSSVVTTNLAAVSFNRISGSFTADFTHILTNHSNVQISSLANGNILKYDSASSKWINVAIPQEHDLATVLDTTTINFGISNQQITGSVIYQMSITSDASGLKLSGDSASPGNSKLYGTNSSGVKGWYDIPTSGTPTAHHATHENGGADEISVTGLSGLLADGQHPLSHASTHISTGSDAIPLFTTSASGLVPASVSSNTTDYLRRDGTWAAPAGSGSVTSITAGNGMDFSTINSSGPVTLGLPSPLTPTTTNALTSGSHTHAITGFAKIGSGNTSRVAIWSDSTTISSSGNFRFLNSTLYLQESTHRLNITPGAIAEIFTPEPLKISSKQLRLSSVNLTYSDTYLHIKDNNSTPYDNVLLITDSNDDEIFKITKEGKLYIANSTKLTETTTTKSLYYNTTTGEVSFGNAASGGSSVWIADTNGIHYSTGNVGIGNDSSSSVVLKITGSSSGNYIQEVRQSHSDGHGLRVMLDGGISDPGTILSLNRSLTYEIFKFTLGSEFYLRELPTAVSSHFMYYDPSNNGKITHGVPDFYTKSVSDARFLRIDGSNSMTGNLNMGTHNLYNAGTITAYGPTDAPTLSIHASATTQGNPSNLPAQTTALFRRNVTSGYTNYLAMIAGSNSFNSILFGDSTSAFKAEMRVNNSDNTIEFYINGNKMFVIDSSGNTYAAGTMKAIDFTNDPTPLP